MTTAEAILIGLRSSLVILCVAGLSAMVHDEREYTPEEKWRRFGWACVLVATGLIWSPLALMNLGGEAALAWANGHVGMAMRLAGSLGYVIAIAAVVYSKALSNGVTNRRALAAASNIILIVFGCVGFALMVRQ